MSREGERRSGAWTHVSRRKGTAEIRNSNTHNLNFRSVVGVTTGHRGSSRHQWWRGPREPRPSTLGHNSVGVYSLFIDGIARSASLSDLRTVFEREGQVADVYISGKKRNNKNVSFGFIRYYTEEEARMAVQNLDGFVIHGKKLKVSMAKYFKGEAPMDSTKRKIPSKFIQSPALRDHRKYSEVLEQVPLKLYENHVVKSRLKYAIVVEDELLPELKNASELIINSNFPVVCLSSMSPNKIIVFLENEEKVLEALDENSPFRKLFQFVRKWDHDEGSKERLVWLEITGIQPICWSHGNLMLIGNKWGRTVRIQNVKHGFNSLTSARILVRTKSHKRIDEGVQVQWESGTSEVWVQEMIDVTGKLGDRLEQETLIEEDPNNCGFIDDHTTSNNGDIDCENETRLVEVVDLENQRGPLQNEASMEKGDMEGIHVEVVIGECRHNKENFVVDLSKDEEGSMTQEPMNNEMNGLKQFGVPNAQPCVCNETVNAEQNKVLSVTPVLCAEGQYTVAVDAGHDSVQANPLHSEQTPVQDSEQSEQPQLHGDSDGNEMQIVEYEHGANSGWNTISQNVSVEEQQLIFCSDNVRLEDRFDPIYSVEVPVSFQYFGKTYPNGGSSISENVMVKLKSISQKRPKGRPKRIVQSLPEPLLIQSSPLNSQDEAVETWNTAKRIGVKANDEGAVISALRKSKRLMALEESGHLGEL
ncbi:unnamed protein product [Amaranthus hypochondriacus]